MAVIMNGKVFVNGVYVGETEEVADGIVIDVDYERQNIYVID